MKQSSFRYFLVFSLYILFYSCITTYLKLQGYLNFEHLYISHNFVLAYGENSEIIKKFFFSYPIIAHIVATPFTLVSVLDAPFYASIFFTSLLNTFIIKKINVQKFSYFSIVVGLYLLFSPLLIYAATSGGSFYLYYLIYFLLFYYLYNYTISYATYFLTLTSLIISCLPFLNHKILWLLLLLVPILFFYSALSIQGVKTNMVVKFKRIFANESLRRRFIGRFVSMNVIIVFFPLAIYCIYLLINDLYGADKYFFLKNNTSSWYGTGLENFVSTKNQYKHSLASSNSYNFIFLFLFVLLFFIVELCIDLNNKIKLSSFFIAPCLIIILLKISQIEILKINYFSIFTFMALASFVSFNQKNLKKNKFIKKTLYSLCFVCSIYFEFQYFKKTIDIQEKTFYQSGILHKNNDVLESYKYAASYLKNKVNTDQIILCDNSIFYPIISLDNRRHTFVQNLSEDYILALNSPENFSDYIIISKENSPFYNQDNLAAISKNKNKRLGKSIVYEGKYFRILKTH